MKCFGTLLAVALVTSTVPASSALAQDVACCLPDGQCVYVIGLDECLMLGGYFPPGNVCLGDSNLNGMDDACEHGTEAACCMPDGTCQYIEPIECWNIGGFLAPGGICLGDGNGNNIDDACEGQEDKACCLPDGNCVYLPPTECDSQGGWIPPGGVCLGDLNGNLIDDACEDPQDLGCCLPDGNCVWVLSVNECLDLGGWIPPGGVCLGDNNGNNVDDACEDPAIGCCLDDGSCVFVFTVSECDALSGWVPPGGVCLGDGNGNNIDDACEDQEEKACCLPDGTCMLLPPLDCEQQGGWFPPLGICLGDLNGNNVDDACEDPSIGCCLDDGSCVYVYTPDECDAMGGYVPPLGICLGDNNGNNVDDACEDPAIGCCLDDGSCVFVFTVTECDAMGGYVPPPGVCLGDNNGNLVDDACEDPAIGCCLDDGSCVFVFTVPECDALGGWVPAGGVCLGDGNSNGVDDACEDPQEIGCCLDDGSCVWVGSAADCDGMGGWVPPGGVCLGDGNSNGVDDACEDEPTDFRFEFSLDIGSDTELSDPFMDGDEGFDPGDVYWWQGPLVPPGGRDGFKDDMRIFGQDPWPDPPDTIPPSTRVPVGNVFSPPEPTEEWYAEFFDLDGHDQLDISLIELIPPHQPSFEPIFKFDSHCIFEPMFLMVSFDDDMGPGWMAPPMGDVPVTSPSPAGVSSYGTTGARDEIVGIDLAAGMPAPVPLLATYPIADEITVHQSMAPNPDGIEEQDDDVDSLDVVENEDICPFWFFSPDHEATFRDPQTGMPLDPGGIYEVTTPGFPVQVIDEMIHLGIPEETDIDAFEFTWLIHEEYGPVLALLFSVDDDDPLTGPDESGGLMPQMIYYSFLDGLSREYTEPLWDDIDALTIWRESMHPQPQCPQEAWFIPTPPNGVVDARKPHPSTAVTPCYGLGMPDDPATAVDEYVMSPIVIDLGVNGAGAMQCWSLCETPDMSQTPCGPNAIIGVIDNGNGTYNIDLAHGVAAGAVTTVQYNGGPFVEYAHHPSNVDGSSFANANDIIAVVNCLNSPGSCTGIEADIDYSGAQTAGDIIETIDLLNGAGAYNAWFGTPLPVNPGNCP